MSSLLLAVAAKSSKSKRMDKLKIYIYLSDAAGTNTAASVH